MNRSILFLSLLVALFSTELNATIHTITTEGLSYVPSDLVVEVGDTVLFDVQSNHPTVQVSESTYDSNGSSVLPGGFGPYSSPTELIIEPGMDPIMYYICQNHISSGMKGKISTTISGVDDLTNALDFEFGPNPVENNQLNYSIGYEGFTSASVEIYSLDGKLVFVTALTEREGTLYIDLSKGNYILTISDETKNILSTDRISFR